MKMIVIELNEADKRFIEDSENQSELPTLHKLLTSGKSIETRVDAWNDFEKHKITARGIWSSIYSGLSPSEHGISHLGEENTLLEGKTLWDYLNQHKITSGIVGNVSFNPVKNHPNTLFYIPEAISNTQCYPQKYKPVHDLLVFLSSHSISTFNLIKSFWAAILSIFLGINPVHLFQILKTLFLDKSNHHSFDKNRIFMKVKLEMTLFEMLYKKYLPRFSTLHLNHIGYIQHAPKSQNDILDSYKLVDGFLARFLPVMDQDTILMILSGPVHTHNYKQIDTITKPEIHLKNIKKLLQFADIHDYELQTDMGPSITLNLKNSAEASLAAFKLSSLKVLGEHGLFKIEQNENQLFLEGTVPISFWSLAEEAWIEHDITGKVIKLFEHVRLTEIGLHAKDYLTGNGWMLLYGNIQKFSNLPAKIELTEISQFLLKFL